METDSSWYRSDAAALQWRGSVTWTISKIQIFLVHLGENIFHLMHLGKYTSIVVRTNPRMNLLHNINVYSVEWLKKYSSVIGVLRIFSLFPTHFIEISPQLYIHLVFSAIDFCKM